MSLKNGQDIVLTAMKAYQIKRLQMKIMEIKYITLSNEWKHTEKKDSYSPSI